jgi:hypothetical protein
VHASIRLRAHGGPDLRDGGDWDARGEWETAMETVGLGTSRRWRLTKSSTRSGFRSANTEAEMTNSPS